MRALRVRAHATVHAASRVRAWCGAGGPVCVCVCVRARARAAKL